MVGRVLIVDDEDTLRLTIKTRLASGGFETDAAVDGEEALEKLKQSRFDVVLLDINMPRMDGITALGIISDLHPHTDVIMLTGFADFTTAIECLKKGAKDYLVKPIDTTELITRLRSLLRARNSEAALDELKGGQAAFLLDKVYASVRLAGQLLRELKGAKLSKDQGQILASVSSSLEDLADDATKGVDPAILTKKRGAGELKNLPLSRILSPAIDSVKRTAKAMGVNVEYHADKQSAKIECDPQRLGGAFHSVASGMLLAAGKGASLRIGESSTKEDVAVEFHLDKSTEKAKKAADQLSKAEEISGKGFASFEDSAIVWVSARSSIRNHKGTMEVQSTKGSLTIKCRVPFHRKEH